MKTNKFFLSLFLAAMMCVPFRAGAQVTIGSGDAPQSFSVLELISNQNMGLRLPQMTTEQRNALIPELEGNPKAEGLLIFNTSNSCIEGWNGTRWVSFCEGNSQMTIYPKPCQDVPADGDGCEQEFTIADPDCLNGPFSFAIVAGIDFAFFASTSEADGRFTLSFMPNNSVASRSAVVRVFSECTGLSKDFLFTQLEQECEEAAGYPPVITASSNELCIGGAVYLSIPADTPYLENVIWTRNGIEFIRGVSHITVTQPGVYSVSIGFAGCGWVEGQAAPINIRMSGEIAPVFPSIVLSENGGVICGAAGNVMLTALGSPSGVVWFHNGILRTDKSGSSITLIASDVGEWSAAIQDGNCFSQPSNPVTVRVETGAGQVPLNPADILVNGIPISNITSFCPGSSLVLTINNPQPGISYRWFNGNTQIFSPFIIPHDQTTMLLRLVASDDANILCPAEMNSLERSMSGFTPAAPAISGSFGVCSGLTTPLTATAGSDEYQWFFNGVRQTGFSNNYFNAGVGSVTVRARVGECWSPLSAVHSVAGLSAPIIAWHQFVAQANTTDTYTFGVNSIGATAPTSHTWTATPAENAVITGSGASVNIRFNDGATIHVTPANACGPGATISAPVIIVGGRLSTPGITPISGDFCNSVVFTITRPGDWTDAQWNGFSAANIIATRAGAAYNGLLTSNADGTVYFYTVTSSATTNQAVTINFRGSIGGVEIEPLSTTISGINVRTDAANTVLLSGRTCFDIAFQYQGAACVALAHRSPGRANFNTAHTYTLGGTLAAGHTITNVVWSFSTDYGATPASNAITAFVPSALNTTSLANNFVNVNFNPALLTTALGAAGITVTIVATVTISGGVCGTTIHTVTRVVNIRDCACCGIGGTAVRQRIGTRDYYTHEFMTNGVVRCWMVQNLTQIPPGAARNPAGACNNAVPRYWTTFTGRAEGERGFYYNWRAAEIVCPAGWSLPTLTDLNGLRNTVNAMPNNTNANNPRRFWGVTNALAGYRESADGSFRNWGIWSTWQGMNQTEAISQSPGTITTRGLLRGRAQTVRCIQNQ